MDIQAYSPRTDLALEANEMASQRSGSAIPGVDMKQERDEEMTITRMSILTMEAARSVGKMIGEYLTIEAPALRQKDSDLQDRVATGFAKHFAQFLTDKGISKDAKVLIVGLGNMHVTPDALGPLVVDNVLITRHFFELMPDQVNDGYRSVSALAPGVLGTTGMESTDIVFAVVQQSKPDLIIAIDALASRSLDRVNTTIQIADSGIHPGSGIGNKRKALTQESLGIPVIAIGIPTVVFASTIVNSAIELMQQHMSQTNNGTASNLNTSPGQTAADNTNFGLLDHMKEEERLKLVRDVLNPLGHDLLVTPKEVDEFIEDMANILASGLNAALHEAIDQDNVAAYTH